MLSHETIENLVSQRDKIQALANNYGLNSIALIKPLFSNDMKLHFLMSKKDGAILSFEEQAEIRRSLCDLLKADWFSENIIIKDKELFREDYFKEEYGESLIFMKDTSKQEVIEFIKGKLGFEYTPVVDSDNKRSNQEKNEQELDPDSVQEGPLAKKPKIYSSSLDVLFSDSSKKASISGGDGLPPEIKEPLQVALKGIQESPQYKSEAIDFFLKQLQQSNKPISGKG